MLKWLSGKKTIIGIVGLAIGHALEKAAVLPIGTCETVILLAKTIIGLGLVHKADKLIVAVNSSKGG
jgi:hypothetical protein